MEAQNDIMDLEEDTQLSTLDINAILDNGANVATKLDEDLLKLIGNQVIEDFDLDRTTMGDWLKDLDDGIKLAEQRIQMKTEPWPGASNIKHSLILEACIQFSARALPEIIRDDKVCKPKIFGRDPSGEKLRRGMRMATYMNWDFLAGMPTWEEDFDRLLMVLSMVGTVFKKTYYCAVDQRNKSELCLPNKVTVNQNTKNMASCRRITHEIELFYSEIEERERIGVFLDAEYKNNEDQDYPRNDQPYTYLEQHRYLDLDGDGLAEPYVVTVHEDSRQVVRITPCFDQNDIDFDFDEDGNYSVTKIRRKTYFSDYHFIHSIDGTFFSYGFGYLLSHATHTINTLLNQLVDAGTLDNLQSGFIGKGARIRGGQIAFKPGKWIKADSSGVDLKNAIVPLPTKGPSTVLFSLAQFLLQSYYKMISLSEIMSGTISGSNTTAQEAMAAVEQGMKVMNAVYKRIYRGLKKEMNQLYRLNRDYLDNTQYQTVLDDPEADVNRDFESLSHDLIPVADSSMSSQIEEVMKLRSVVEMLQFLPEIQRIPLGRRMLQAMRIENIDEILPAQDPNQPSPQQQQFAKMLQEKEQELNFKDREVRVKEGELQVKAIKMQFETQKMAAEIQAMLQKLQLDGATLDIKAVEAFAKQLSAKAAYIQAITPDNQSKEASR